MKIKLTVRVPVPLEVELKLDRENIDIEVLQANIRPEAMGTALSPATATEIREEIRAEMQRLHGDNEEQTLYEKTMDDLLEEASETIHLHYKDRVLCGAKEVTMKTDNYYWGLKKRIRHMCQACVDDLNRVLSTIE